MNFSVEWNGPGEQDATHVRVAVPPETHESAFDPFPGSEAGIARGCTCPVQRRWPHALIFALDCPAHELARVPS